MDKNKMRKIALNDGVLDMLKALLKEMEGSEQVRNPDRLEGEDKE